MADQPNLNSGIRRSAVYSYLRPLLDGRRVLEVGCGTGEAAAHLVRLGARSVIGAGSAREVAEARGRQRAGALGFVTMAAGAIDAAGTFDLVLVPDAADILRGQGPIQLSALLALVTPGGRLACMVANGDRGDGLAYYDVVDALTPHFPKVRMFGQTPFLAFGIAEFDETAADLRVDAELAERESEEPTHYIALGGPDEPMGLGYALVQIPAGDWDGSVQTERAPISAGIKAPDTTQAELRQKLLDSEGKAEGLVRVSRAQSEEIEELRARLRRTAEARAELDEEVRRLRRSLVEADESVVSLTRKTTEELTALAQRLTAGLRSDEPGPAPGEELQRREKELAERESALSERDDRIAALETAKQEALWRADAADDELGRTRAELANLRAERDRAISRVQAEDEVLASLKAQEATIEDFRRAAAAHVEEVNRLRDAANEQASLVTELEEALAESEKQLASHVAEVARLQKALSEIEDADRVRRSRLAELEGLMLRAEHAQAKQNESRQQDLAELGNLRARAAAGRGEIDNLRARLAQAEEALAAPAAPSADAERLAELEAQVRDSGEREHRITELEAQVRDSDERERRLAELEAQVRDGNERERRLAELEAQVRDSDQRERRLAELEAQVRDSDERERRLAELEARVHENDERERRLAELEARVHENDERERRLAELRSEAPDPEEVYERLFDLETQYQAATMAAARVPALEAKLAELEIRLAQVRNP
jgi:SAM-dependent methyltransferase/chromosome segregation ATPase